MFDIGFWEMAVIGVIALLVVGPERLPALARNIGRWVGTARRYVSHIKSDIERELHADEMRELLEQPEGLESIRDVARDTAAVLEDTRNEINSIANDAEAGIKEQVHSDADDGASSASDGGESAERLAPHHAVDEDPFASASVSAQASNAAADQSPAGESWSDSLSESSTASPTTASTDQGDAATSSDSATNEQRTGQPGQR